MVRSIGLDIVEVARIERDVGRFGKRFVSRVLGKEELATYHRRKDKSVFLAGRFAAKEAVIKGLRPFLKERPPLNVIQIVNDSTGAPSLVLPPEMQQKLGGAVCFLSLSHEKNYAAAVALFTEDK